MSTPWPEDPTPDTSRTSSVPPDGVGGEEERFDDAEARAALSDPYARVHESLDRSVREGDIPSGWHLTDFVVVGAAESTRAGQWDQTLMLYVGPRDEPPPHRVVGLLDYARQRYSHRMTCCQCGGPDGDYLDEDDLDEGGPGPVA